MPSVSMTMIIIGAVIVTRAAGSDIDPGTIIARAGAIVGIIGAVVGIVRADVKTQFYPSFLNREIGIDAVGNEGCCEYCQ